MTVIRPNSISGVTSITSQSGDIQIFRADGSVSDLTVNNITSGVVTATTFSGNISGATGTFTGNLGVGGVLTYEDVTNVDSVGVITARDGIRCTGIVTATAFHGDGSSLTGITVGGGYKNLIINGGMLVAQRGSTSTSQGFQTVDRFAAWFSGTDEAPTQSTFEVSPPSSPYHLPTSGAHPYKEGFRQAFGVTNGNQTSGAGAGDYVFIRYKVEAQDIANSGWDYTSASSYITLSFWVKSSVAQNFNCRLETADGTNQNYPFETGSLSAFTWTKITKTIPGNANLTFDNNNGNGLEIHWQMFRGTDFTDNSVSNDTWAAYASGTRTKDATSTWYTTNDASFQITGVQLEVGSVVTPFEHRSFADELKRCQRYCFRLGGSIGGDSEVYTTLAFGIHSNATVAKCHIIHPVTMRSKDVEFSVSNITLDDDVASYNSGNYSSINSVQSSSNISTLVLNTANYGAGAGRVTRVLVSTAGGYIQGECEI